MTRISYLSPALVLIALLAGCAGSPRAIKTESAQEIQKNDFMEVCFAYTFHQTETIANELVRRGISERDLPNIATRSVRIGMSERAAVCSWGRYERVNTTTTANGTRKQFVYGSGRYLYTTNGRVTAFQD